MELDGFLKLVDAERNVATTQANVANTMADVATKIANLSLIREQVIKARLDNIAKFLDISWDVTAHKDLIKIRNIARQKAKQLERNVKIAADKLDDLSTVLSGGASDTGIRDGWIGFQFFRQRVTRLATAEIGKIKMPEKIYDPDHWYAPGTKQVRPIAANQHDFGHLVDWARTGGYIPKLPSPAWDVFAAYIEAMNDAAAKWAAAKDSEADEAAKVAEQLSKEDWNRLKKGETNK